MKNKNYVSQQEIPTEKLLKKRASIERELDIRSGKISGEIWWHWVMEKCMPCKISYSQSPVQDEMGEDLNLFQAVNQYNEDQRDGETNYVCDHCNKKLHMVYRHAIADWNCVVDNVGRLFKHPLFKGQKHGENLTSEQFKILTSNEAKTIEI